jgi:hypothetical protein
LGQTRSEIFLQEGLDRKSTDALICPSGKSVDQSCVIA